MKTKHILIVEDDDKIRFLLSKFLSENGFALSTAPTIKEAHQVIDYFQIDLIILDVMLPDGSGFDFIQNFSELDTTPIIILSALGHVDDKIYGLEHGAIDYITKPFDPRELLLKIKNILDLKKATHSEANTLSFGEFIFNKDSGTLIQGSEPVRLTNNERNLMRLFANKVGNPISRDEIAENFNNMNYNAIDTMINRLRHKIEIDPKKPQFILTERNKGYSFWR